MKHSEKPNGKHPPSKGTAQTDTSLEIKLVITVIPPGRMKDRLHQYCSYIFQCSRHNNTANIQPQQISTDGSQDCVDRYCPASVYGAERSVDKATVYLFPTLYRHVTGLPHPAEETVYDEPINEMIKINSQNR